MESSPYTIRPAEERDWGCIRAYWSDSFRKSRWAGVIPNNIWRDVRDVLVSQLRERGSQALVACAREDSDTLLAFIVFEGEVLHYLYTKEALRRHGLAKALMLEAGISSDCRYTHRTIDSSYFPRARFSPEIARRNGKFNSKE